MNNNSFVPVVIDLFAGPGGLSEGFWQSGFEIASQVEYDRTACDTLRLRVAFRELKRSHRLREYWELIRTSPDRIVPDHLIDEQPRCNIQVVQHEFGVESPTKIYHGIREGLKFVGAQRPNVLLGGPPCQPFSLVGRSRDPQRMRQDKRQSLFQYFLLALDEFEPDFFVFENVPGLLTARNDSGHIWELLMNEFHELKRPYKLAMPDAEKQDSRLILDSANFGVPQHRRRVFLIGYREDIEKKRPEASFVFRQLAEKAARAKGVLTVEDAIGDLPILNPGDGYDGWWGEYQERQNLKAYQIKMQQHSEGIVNHKARTHMHSDLERYRFFIEHPMDGAKSVTLENLERERPDLMPAHKHTDKFLDRFRVQWWNRPCSTVMSHIQKDGHYYIHPDIHQCRSFTVREAARCQSFPDSFVFCGYRTDQFRQVGNAVPPRLAAAIANALATELRQIYGS